MPKDARSVSNLVAPDEKALMEMRRMMLGLPVVSPSMVERALIAYNNFKAQHGTTLSSSMESKMMEQVLQAAIESGGG